MIERLSHDRSRGQIAGSAAVNRSFGADSSFRNSDRPMPNKKKFKEESEQGGHVKISHFFVESSRRRKDSTGDSDKSPSLFEELSIGNSIDQIPDNDRGLRRNRTRSITRLRAATN